MDASEGKIVRNELQAGGMKVEFFEANVMGACFHGVHPVEMA
jgi:hypothetical protein